MYVYEKLQLQNFIKCYITGQQGVDDVENGTMKFKHTYICTHILYRVIHFVGSKGQRCIADICPT